MRIIVVSDTHGDFHSLQKLVEKHRRDAELFMHLGDGAQDVEQIRTLYPKCRILQVRGNSDIGSDAMFLGCFSLGPARIFYTHGHLYNVKFDMEQLLQAAKEVEANVVLFGHTHQALYQYRSGVHLLNPGSLGHPKDGKKSYGVVDLTEQGIVCFINPL